MVVAAPILLMQFVTQMVLMVDAAHHTAFVAQRRASEFPSSSHTRIPLT